VKLISHLNQQQEDLQTTNDRKIDLLKQEVNKHKNDVFALKQQ